MLNQSALEANIVPWVRWWIIYILLVCLGGDLSAFILAEWKDPRDKGKIRQRSKK